MKKIIVLGAGIGGIPMAYELKERLGDKVHLTLVSDDDYFQFVPSNPWVSLGWRAADDVKVFLPPVLKKLGIHFNSSGVKTIEPDKDSMTLNDGQKLEYDYLVIATGAALAFDEIEGLGPDKNTVSICKTDHALEMNKKWEEFCKNPGPIVVGAVQGASCFGPAYEIALMMDTDLRKRKIRDHVPITFVTSEPYIGHLGLGGVGDTKGMLESVFRDHDIKWITNAKVSKIDPESVHVDECDENGQPKRAHDILSRFTMFIPPFKGIQPLVDIESRGIQGVANKRGFVIVDQYQSNPTFKNIFAVGVCVAIPPVESTPVPVGVPKTGYMIESMVTAVANNIQEALEGKSPSHIPSLNAVCFADFGHWGVALVAEPELPPRNVNWASEGRWVHWAKVGFEKYFLYKVKHGTSDPIYEHVVMKLLGIHKLKK